VKNIIGLWIIVFALSTNCFASETIEKNSKDLNSVSCPEQRPAMCTREYKPVCALNQNNKQKTYSNACTACSNNQIVSFVTQACLAHTLSADELTKLFSGNTYVAQIPSRKITMTVYVDPDGTMKGMQSGHKFASKWEVNNNGEICVSYKGRLSCSTVIEQDGIYKKIKTNNKGEKITMVIYESFTAGNINNY